jgi:anti-sigma factor RsiW
MTGSQPAVYNSQFAICNSGPPMSITPQPVDPALREELVAYLDGELDSQQSRRIEERLANEPDVRRAMQGLDRTWQMLDELEKPSLGEDFTRSTLEMAAVAAEADLSEAQEKAPRRGVLRWGMLGGGVVAACLAGFAAVALLSPDPNQQLVQDLPVLDHFDQYRQVDSIDFLRMLEHEKLFTEDMRDAP